ncbi:hypothetical protein [Kitasatospora sp. NPDC004289]
MEDLRLGVIRFGPLLSLEVADRRRGHGTVVAAPGDTDPAALKRGSGRLGVDDCIQDPALTACFDDGPEPTAAG